MLFSTVCRGSVRQDKIAPLALGSRNDYIGNDGNDAPGGGLILARAGCRKRFASVFAAPA